MLSPREYFKQLDAELISTHFAMDTYFDSPDSQDNAIYKFQNKFAANPSAFCLPEQELEESQTFRAECDNIKNYYEMAECARRYINRRAMYYVFFLISACLCCHTISNVALHKQQTYKSLLWSAVEIALFMIYVYLPQRRGPGGAFVVARITGSIIRLQDRFATDISFSIDERAMLGLTCIGIVIEQMVTARRASWIASRSGIKSLAKVIPCVLLPHAASLLLMHWMVIRSSIDLSSEESSHQRNLLVFAQCVTVWSILFQWCLSLRTWLFYHKGRPLSGLRIKGVQPSLLFFPEILADTSIVNKVLLRNFLKAIDFARSKKSPLLLEMAQTNLMKCLKQMLEQLPTKMICGRAARFQLGMVEQLIARCLRSEDPIVQSADFHEMDSLLKFRLL